MAARREVARHFDGLDLPGTDCARHGRQRPLAARLPAAGSTPTSLAAQSGRSPGARVPARANLDLDPLRAGTLLAGAIILSEAQHRLGVPLEVARGGLREGAAAALLEELAAA